MSLFDKTFDPKDAKPHERHNRARAALIGYKREAGLTEYYIDGISDRSVLCAMLVDIQLMLMRDEGDRERRWLLANKLDHEPTFKDHPDARGIEFIVSIGGMDFYLGDETTSSTFIVITGPEGGDYQTTDNLLRLLPGFFQAAR